jgi:E3 ubiquitin-protein ligase BOI and related proteins
MAVQAQLGGFPAECLPPCGGGFAEEQAWALRDYGALQWSHCPGMVSGAQSELTCNGSGGGGVLPSRKRGREADHIEQFESVQKASWVVDSAAASTSAATALSSAQDALLSELCRQGAEIDALVRAECARLRAGLEHARERQRVELARAVCGRLRQVDGELDAARRRSAELEERLRQAAGESQAWCGVARTNEAVAAELRAALDLVLRGDAGGVVEGFGESGGKFFEAGDAQSCCLEAKDNTKWACKACGERESSVLLLPCRHLCLCKACEPRHDACPVCLAAKNASIHVDPN